LPQGGNARLSFLAVAEAHEHRDAPHPRRLLRSGRERSGRCRAAEQRDELAPFQLIERIQIPLTGGKRTGEYPTVRDQSAVQFTLHNLNRSEMC
jgi:hypothetical protein